MLELKTFDSLPDAVKNAVNAFLFLRRHLGKLILGQRIVILVLGQGIVVLVLVILVSASCFLSLLSLTVGNLFILGVPWVLHQGDCNFKVELLPFPADEGIILAAFLPFALSHQLVLPLFFLQLQLFLQLQSLLQLQLHV